VKYFVLIRAGLLRKKARTILTMLSIIVAFMLFGLLQGINQDIKGGFGASSNGRLWTTSRAGGLNSMPISLMEHIAGIEGVRSIAHVSFFGGYFQDAKNALPAFATNVDKLAAVYPELNITQAQIDAMKTTRAGVLVGRPLADKYGWKIGDEIPVGTTLWPNSQSRNSWTFDIVGIFDAAPNYAQTSLGSGFWINYDYWDAARLSDLHHVHQFLFRIDDPTRATAVAAQVDKIFENSSDETRTQSENAAIQSQLKQLADIGFIANAITGAVMFTLLFLSANTMMQSVRERIPELAVLRTLGFAAGTVCWLVIAESLLMCLSAATAGLVLSAGAIRLVGAALGTGMLPPIVILGGLGIAVALAIISAATPAMLAQRLNIVDALAQR
jgi:putative ABC transport system permease protein